MNSISNLIQDPTKTQETDQLFAQIKKDLGAPFVPNFFQVWGDAPEALSGIFPSMKSILASGKLDRKLKEMIILAISARNGCHYCEAAHQAFCMMMGGKNEEIAALKSTFTLPDGADQKQKSAIDFAVKLAIDSSSATTEDVSHLASLGYSKEEIMELIAMSGMSVFYNHLADATKINIDEAFTKG